MRSTLLLLGALGCGCAGSVKAEDACAETHRREAQVERELAREHIMA